MNSTNKKKRKTRRWVRSGLIFLATLTLTIVSVDKLAIQPAIKKEREKTSYEQKLKNQALAKSYAEAGFGWKGREWECLFGLWSVESRFDNLAKNRQGSSAYGIAQLLGESDSRPEYQILRGLKYISKRYGTPCKALHFHIRNGHY